MSGRKGTALVPLLPAVAETATRNQTQTSDQHVKDQNSEIKGNPLPCSFTLPYRGVNDPGTGTQRADVAFFIFCGVGQDASPLKLFRHQMDCALTCESKSSFECARTQSHACRHRPATPTRTLVSRRFYRCSLRHRSMRGRSRACGLAGLPWGFLPAAAPPRGR